MMKPEDSTLFDMIVGSECESVAMCAVGHKRKDLIEGLRRVGIEVNVYDYQPHLNVDGDYNEVDIIFDDVTFTEDLIVHCSAERTYPIGKVHKGDIILCYEDQPHNGSCTKYDRPFVGLVEDNNIEELDRARVGTKFIVYGYSL